MTSSSTGQFGDEARLWLAALMISILLNGLLLGWVSYEAILSKIDKDMELSKPKPETESIVMLFPEMFEEDSEEVSPDDDDPKAVRTSDDQTSPEAPSSRRYIGERDTQATSDRVATNDDSTMPSQKGREAILEELETTESVYQDGRLDTPVQSTSPNQLMPLPDEPFSPLAPSAGSMKGEKLPDPGEEDLSQTAIREKLLEGPNIVEKEVSEFEVEENIKPREQKKTQDGDPQGLALKKSSEQPKPTAKPTNSSLNDPAFSGNQTKTAIRGNISRTGRSALDVVDTPMGRYQAQISRAVELEFQRNCVRYGDFIVPGYVAIRFFVDDQGRITKLDVEKDIEGGEVQKGFTINSVRDAEIPAMPPEIKQEMGDHSLELIFNFIF